MAKIVRPDGKITYYYYQKKRGRHKKTGPKKKKKKRGKQFQDKWDFKIIQFNNRVQGEYIGVYHDAFEAETAKKMLLERNAEVVFPKKFTNNGTLEEFNSEYLILRKIRNENADNTSRLRNEYGKLVEHKYSDKGWMIYDKFPQLVEETFWVYGYNPRTDRKTFQWILDNIVVGDTENMTDDELYYDSTVVFVYLNKVFVQKDEDFEFIICKNKEDAKRMYSELEQRTKKRRRNVFFVGEIRGGTFRGRELIKKIKKKTGWDEHKICRSSTRS